MAESFGPTHGAARLRGYAHGAARSGVNYLTNLLWLLRRSLVGGRTRLVTLLGLGQLSLAAQGLAIGALYWYTAQMQADVVLTLGPLGEWRAREEPLLLWGTVITSVGAFAASAWFQYLGRHMGFAFGEDEMLRGLPESVRWARRLPDARAQTASRLLADQGFKPVSVGCRNAGLTVSLLYGAVSPVVGGIVAVGVMLWMDPGLTLLIAVTVVLWSPTLYPLARRQTDVSASKAGKVRAFNLQCHRLVDFPAVPIPESWGGPRQVADATLGKRRVSNQMTFLTGVGATLIGGIAAVTLASRIISEQGEWSFFVAYLMIMRTAVAGCLVAPQTVAMVSRFYPQTVTYVQFLKSAVRIDETDLGRIAHGDAVTLGTLPAGEVASAQAGQRVALVTVDAPRAIQASMLGATADGSRLPLNTFWLDGAGRAEAAGEHHSIALVERAALAAMQPVERESLLRDLHDTIAVVVHRDVERVGVYGESHLVVSAGGQLTGSAPLGTTDSRDLLAAFAAATAAGTRPSPVAAGDVNADDEADEMEG